jgi:predicted NBD/HSP70 family sugar kinase
MAVIGVDLGGTKISSALSSGEDQFSCFDKIYLEGAKGDEVGELIKARIQFLLICGSVLFFLEIFLVF